MTKNLQIIPLFLTVIAAPLSAQELKWDGSSIQNSLQNERYASPTIEKTKEQIILDRMKAAKERELQAKRRAFDADKKRWGECYLSKQYDWMGWKKSANGTWVTDWRFCWDSSNESKPDIFGSISVSCKGLKISTLYKNGQGWSKWENPDRYEEGMVAKLCAREL